MQQVSATCKIIKICIDFGWIITISNVVRVSQQHVPYKICDIYTYVYLYILFIYLYLCIFSDDVKCYEKAWEFSNHKSSRAQRHWGNFLFDHKKYEECIPHFEKSVEINSIQDRVWLRLG